MDRLALDDGMALAYQLDGNPAGPALVFSNSLGTDLHMWDEQVAALGDTFRIVRYDTRGHGRSGVPAGITNLDRLGRDVLALLDQLGIAQAHLCGLSLGGLTAQWLAIKHPQRVGRIVLANTAARIGSEAIWAARIDAVERGEMAAIADAVLARFFSPRFRAANPAVVQAFGATLVAIDPAGYVACCAAIRDADLRPLVGTIGAPTLVVGGELDEATPPAQAEELYAAIGGSALLIFPGVAHLSNVEQPAEFSEQVRRFLLDEKGATR